MRFFVIIAIALGGIAVGALLVTGTSEDPWGPGAEDPLPPGSTGPSRPPAPPPESAPPPQPSLEELTTPPSAGPDEARLAALLARVERAPTSRRTQRELAAFVVECARRGDSCVAEIATFLASGRDVVCNQPWRFDDEDLAAYPTVRAACLEALRGVRTPAATAALRAALETSPGAGDGYLAARALHERGEGGWEGRALLLARGEESRGDGADRVRPRLVLLAAESNPQETARQIYDDATRGEDRRKPQILSAGLEALPEGLATSVGTGLLNDTTVTPRAKKACVEGLLRRRDVASWRVVGHAVARTGVSEEVRIRAAEVAAGSRIFDHERRLWRRALRDGDASRAKEIEARYRARLEEAEHIARAVWGSGEADSADRKAREALRALNRHRDALDD